MLFPSPMKIEAGYSKKICVAYGIAAEVVEQLVSLQVVV
jgi:hypothetical protein